MPVARINGLSVDYDVVGTGQPWVITPGGRFSKDAPGVRELAQALAGGGKKVLIWDRPNTGASQVCFSGPSESEMQSDVLGGLLRHLDMTPAVIAGGSGDRGFAADRRPAPGCRGRGGRVVDQRGAVRADQPRRPLLRGFNCGGLARRDGGGAGAAGVGRGAGSEPGQPAGVLGPEPS